MPREIDFVKECKVGDSVFDIRHGAGEIFHIECSGEYPVLVIFKGIKKPKPVYYTKNGFYWTEDAHPALFLQPFEIPEKAYQKPPVIKIDTLLYVWDTSAERKVLRYFSHFENDYAICFVDGKTSFTAKGKTSPWMNYEPYKPEEHQQLANAS